MEFEVLIGVTWGEMPADGTHRVTSSSLSLSLDATAEIAFQPTLRTETKISGARLRSGRVLIQGPISFATEVRLRASAAGSLQATKRLVDKRFIKIYWAGQVPIVITGRFTLDAQFQAGADGDLDITQTLDTRLDINAGLEYRDGGWHLIKDAEPSQTYRIRGESDTHASVELRFIPSLDLAFYDVAGGTLRIEPYLYGEAALEGHFLYQYEVDGSGFQDGSDVDYRFTQLEFGGGIDGKFRAGLEAFDKSIIGYPSRNTNEFLEFALIDRTPFLGLPRLTPARSNATNPNDCRAIGLTAAVENVPNPFKALFGGKDSFNPFEDDSAAWQVVLPNGTERLAKGASARDLWFAADRSGRYTLRFAGHSALGSFVRQYEDIQFDYDATQNHCVPSEPSAFPLNDTGIDWCADGSRNFLDCPVDGYPWQDAQDGRDATHNDDSDGHAGFSFTKLDANGNALPSTAANWSCVRDNVTGLVWEVKTYDGGLRDKAWRYSWYNPDSATNGGSAGRADNGNNCYDPSRCDTHKFVADVNAQGLCGARDWRLPNVRELLSIVANDRVDPAIDTRYFPNTSGELVWSTSPSAYRDYEAWGVDFWGGGAHRALKRWGYGIRLVHGGQ